MREKHSDFGSITEKANTIALHTVWRHLVIAAQRVYILPITLTLTHRGTSPTT